MTKDEAVSYFGNSLRMTKALGVRPNAPFSWEDDKIPHLQQIRLEALSCGFLRADDECWAPGEPRYSKAEHREIVRERKRAGTDGHSAFMESNHA